MRPLKPQTKKPSKFKEKIKNFFKIPEEVFQEESSPQFERQKLFTLTRKNIFIGLLLFLLIANLLVIFNVDFIYLRQILGFLFLISVPGLILMLCFKIRNVGFWEYLVYTVGLSISFIMFAGLIVNWTLPALGITNQPLSLYPILICFDIFLLALGIVAFKRNKDFQPKDFTIPKLDTLNKVFFTIPILFPVLAILGAFILNNHGPNYLTMIMLGGIAVYVLLLTIFRKKLDKNIWPWAIWMISLGMLFSGWMRSWYILGTDSNLEYAVFNLTNLNKLWDLNNFRNGYNAILSISLFPSIISKFLELNQIIIFKLIMTFLFSFTPLIIFLFNLNIKKYIKFLAALFFIFQPMFFSGFSIGIRQEIAFLFFGLVLLVTSTEKINYQLKKILFIIFGVSIIVSHYSTAYIFLAIFLSIYFVILAKNIFIAKKYKRTNVQKYDMFFLTGLIILLLFIFGFLWYNQVTPLSGGPINFIKNTLNNFDKLFSDEVSLLGESPFDQIKISKDINTYNLLSNYSNSLENQFKSGNLTNIYPLDDFSKYRPKIASYSSIKSLFNKNIIDFLVIFKSIIESFTKILLILGVILFIFLFRKDFQNILFPLTGLSLFFILFFLPMISFEYGIDRLYLQFLFLFCTPFMVSLCHIQKKISKIHFNLAVLILLLWFFSFSGIIYQMIGGSKINLSQNNAGNYYDISYSHEYDISSGRWIYGSDNGASGNLFIDHSSKSRLIMVKPLDQDKLHTNEDITPLTIRKNSYVYASNLNKVGGISIQVIQRIGIPITFPTEFLNDNKNKIYNNGGSEIFK